MTLVGSIEAGGTKFVLEAADEDGKIVAEGRIPTTSPEETLQKSVEFFKNVPFSLPYLYVALDQAFPGPKLIPTVRDSVDAWFESTCKFRERIASKGRLRLGRISKSTTIGKKAGSSM